jgi:hypothetical protein
MTSLEFMSLNEWDIFLHIERMIFLSLYSNESVTFHSFKQRIVDLIDYHHHLLRYKDERFVKHSQFRYWAFNTQFRHQAVSTNKWVITRSKNKMLNLESLSELIAQDDCKLIDIIARKAIQLRETRSY